MEWAMRLIQTMDLSFRFFVHRESPALFGALQHFAMTHIHPESILKIEMLSER